MSAFMGDSIGLAQKGQSRPIVGAIRWDGWNQWAHYEKCFDPPDWRYRLPFFAKITPDNKARVREDSQEVIDQEIAFARAGGLDYWAFVWYHPRGWPPHSADMGRGFDFYLSSPHKRNINFCLIISGEPHLGPRQELAETTEFLVQRFKDPNYQKVMGNRPLVYFFEIVGIVKYMGSEEAARDWLKELRRKTVAAGAGDPYFVVMAFWPPSGVAQVEKLGGDAIGAYSSHYNGEPVGNKGFSYLALAERNRLQWEMGKRTGKEFIPTVNAGWDYRPMKRPEYPDRNPKDDWFNAPTPQALADNLCSAMKWVDENPSVCPANSVLIYAWNEMSEGGWLVPTLTPSGKPNTERLDAIGRILKADTHAAQPSAAADTLPRAAER
jgi:hypothetical protein